MNHLCWQIVIASGWMISTLVAFVVVFGLAPYLNVEIASINSFVRISYGAFHRSAFALFVGWIIFTCCTLQQCGGYWVNRLLSFKVFAPLSRLCYAPTSSTWTASKCTRPNCAKRFTSPRVSTWWLASDSLRWSSSWASSPRWWSKCPFSTWIKFYSHQQLQQHQQSSARR